MNPEPRLLDGTLQRVVAFLLLPAVASLNAMGWYGLRTTLYPFATDTLELDMSGYSAVISMMTFGHLGGLVLAGLLALALGSRWTLVIGLALTAAGTLLLPLSTASLFPVFVLPAAIGHGISIPALIAAAAEPLSGRRYLLLAGLLALVYAGVNAGALAGPSVIGTFSSELGHAAALVVAGLVALLGAALALGYAVLPGAADRPSALDQRALMPVGRAVAIVLVLGLPVAAYWSSQEAIWMQASMLGISAGWVMSLNPMVVLLMALLAAPILAGLHFGRLRLPLLLPGGLALVCGAALCVALILLPSSASLFAALMVGTGIIEVLLIPVVYAELVGDVHWRLSTTMIASWKFVERGVVLGAAVVAPDPGDPGLVVWTIALAGIAAMGGVVLVIAALPYEWLLRPMMLRDAEPAADVPDEPGAEAPEPEKASADDDPGEADEPTAEAPKPAPDDLGEVDEPTAEAVPADA